MIRPSIEPAHIAKTVLWYTSVGEIWGGARCNFNLAHYRNRPVKKNNIPAPAPPTGNHVRTPRPRPAPIPRPGNSFKLNEFLVRAAPSPARNRQASPPSAPAPAAQTPTRPPVAGPVNQPSPHTKGQGQAGALPHPHAASLPQPHAAPPSTHAATLPPPVTHPAIPPWGLNGGRARAGAGASPRPKARNACLKGAITPIVAQMDRGPATPCS